MPKSELAVEAKNIRKEYPGEILALEGFNFEMKKGEFVSLIGSTGCGKTTFLKIIAGFEDVQRGEIYFNGEPVRGTDWRRGVIFQDVRLFPWMTIRDNLVFGLKARGIPKEKRIGEIEKWAKMMALEDDLDHFPSTLGFGAQQRVGFARVLVSDPEILLCDEPFNALDWPTREYLQTLTLKLWHDTGKTVLFVTHNVEEAVFLAQRVVVMTARPGRTKEIVEVDLPRKRWETKRSDEKFLKIAKYTEGLIEDELTKARKVEREVGY
jgi:NitT/TauT family transport system ATP-binding protein